MPQSSTEQEQYKSDLWTKAPDWIQLVLAVIVLGGGMLATYVANEVARESIKKDVSTHTQEIADLKATVRDVPLLSERVYQLYTQSERQLIVFEKLADSVDRLSTNVARLDERMKAIEGKE